MWVGSVEHLALAMGLFVGLHILVATKPIRSRLVRRFGEKGYQALYSLKSVALLAWVIFAYGHAYDSVVGENLWELPNINHLSMLLMAIAFPMMVAGLLTKNPTAAGQTRALSDPHVIRGIITITRHPFLCSVAIWAIAHLLANGDPRSVVFFGGWLVLAIAGMIHIDAKVMARDPVNFQNFKEKTSRIPFWAAARGTVTIDWSGIINLKFVIGLIIYGIFVLLHERIFGVAPFH